MAKPERLEDLGRIREKIEKLLDQNEAIEAGGMHDEYFLSIYQNNEDRLDSLYRSLKYLVNE